MSNPKSNSAPTNTRRRQYRIGQVSISEINRVLQDMGLRLDQVDAIGQDPDVKGRTLRNIRPESLVKHAANHQDGGADEISIAALSGEAADEQKSAWAKVSGKPTTFAPAAHKTTHQDGGADEISIAALSGEAADEQKSAWDKVSGKPTTLIESTAVLVDHKLIRGDGGARNVQDSTILITDAGIMMNPGQPAFMAAMNTSQLNVTGDATMYSITGAFWTERYDQNNNFANGIFTAPVTGRYHFDMIISVYGILAAHTVLYSILSTSNGDKYLEQVNPYQIATATGYLFISSSLDVEMDVNDVAYMKVQVHHGTKVIDVETGNTKFSGHLVC